jgi:ATP-dependent Lhr-like helicase
LQTHALIGLTDLTMRYPIGAVEAAELLELWCEEGKVVQLGDAGHSAESRWAERGNLREMRRTTVAARRRESLAVQPEVFADFLLRRQYVHPATALGEGSSAVLEVLDQLQGYSAAATSWESEILPRRVKGYRPAWLDEALARGNWFWRAHAQGRDEPRIAFFSREFPGYPGPAVQLEGLPERESAVLDLLDRHGASFAVDLARHSGREPSQVRGSLKGLMRRGLVTNDRFDPVREGSDGVLEALSAAGMARRTGLAKSRRTRRAISAQPEGRWWRLPPVDAEAEASLVRWSDILLARYGVLTREVVALESSAPAWGQLAPILSRSEWRGEVRRGYFIEGLSGLQYATEQAAGELGRLAATVGSDPPVTQSEDDCGCRSDPALPSALTMVCATDPANLYGAGAPLDIELLEGGVARLPRGRGNYLILRDGRPVLIIESEGKRLTGLAWAARGDLEQALGFLPSLTGRGRRILKIERYNGGPVAESVIGARLRELGFVRDYPGMTLYAGWPAAMPSG